MIRLGILGSTRGTDLQAILDAIHEKQVNATVGVVISTLVVGTLTWWALPWARRATPGSHKGGSGAPRSEGVAELGKV